MIQVCLRGRRGERVLGRVLFTLASSLFSTVITGCAADGSSRRVPTPEEDPKEEIGTRPAPRDASRAGSTSTRPALPDGSLDGPAAEVAKPPAPDAEGSEPDSVPGADAVPDAAPPSAGRYSCPVPRRETPLPQRPNVVVILLDDLGWRDFGSYGSTFYETPRIDRLAAQGMKFTQAYSASTVCSPTRAALLTGKSPARLRVTDWIPGHPPPADAKLQIPNWTKYLPLAEMTLPEAIAPSGYVSAHIGKWHLGDSPYYPEKNGFAVNVGGTHQGEPPSYFVPYGIPNLPDGPRGEYLTDRLATEAIRFIERNREKPFFLHLSHYAPHLPLQAKETLIAKYRAKVRPGDVQNNPTYAAMIESIDQSVGRVVDRIEALGLSDRTLVIVTSDNGGVLTFRGGTVTSNAPLRDGKGGPYEGGVRVPFILKWPGVVPEGVECETPVISMDLFPTILEVAGVSAPEDPLDGKSLVPVFTGREPLQRDALYWHYPHYHRARPHGVVRDGDFRLVEFFEDGRLELYDLAKDLGESRNLAAAMPAKAMELRQKLAAWRKAVGAQMPQRK
jgi:arylsulfatase A